MSWGGMVGDSVGGVSVVVAGTVGNVLPFLPPVEYTFVSEGVLPFS